MNRNLMHRVNAAMWTIITLACLVIAGLDTIILTWWQMLLLIPTMCVGMCMAFSEALLVNPNPDPEAKEGR